MDRKRILMKHLSLSFIYRILSMLLSYLSIPFFLNYLGVRDYGLWMVIYSTVNWIYMFDLGIGNGLTNELTKNFLERKFKSMREYITTGYITVSIIALVILIVGTFIIANISLSNMLNIQEYREDYLKKVFFIVFFLTTLNFVTMLYKNFYMAEHNSTISNLSNIILQGGFLIFLVALNKFGKVSLMSIAIIYPSLNLFLNLLFTCKYFYKNIFLIPSIKFFRKEKIKKITKVGIEFFLIQLSMLVIFTTDNILITRMLGTEAVAEYNIVSKIFQMLIVISSIVLTPFWTLFLDAYAKNDDKWIISVLKKLNILFVVLILVVIILVFKSPIIIKIWLGKEYLFPRYLISFFGIFVILRVYSDIYMYFLNGIGHIKFQMYLYIFGAILNIPLSIIFVKNFGLQSSGVILATNLCILPLTIFMPIQSINIIKKMNKPV